MSLQKSGASSRFRPGREWLDKVQSNLRQKDNDAARADGSSGGAKERTGRERRDDLCKCHFGCVSVAET
jgi:hypothetical protein